MLNKPRFATSLKCNCAMKLNYNRETVVTKEQESGYKLVGWLQWCPEWVPSRQAQALPQAGCTSIPMTGANVAPGCQLEKVIPSRVLDFPCSVFIVIKKLTSFAFWGEERLWRLVLTSTIVMYVSHGMDTFALGNAVFSLEWIWI